LHLYNLPLVFALIGLVFYAVLAGADFGAGFWQLTAGRGDAGRRIRDHAHHSIGPVWEANHVWLIFVITVLWTAYPSAFASIASTLVYPLFVAAIGIVLRGGAYALRSETAESREQRLVDAVFSISSVITPFALGTVIGAVATQRIPVGNAAGDLVTSWLNPTSIVVGALAVTTSAYTAAVFLSADAVRRGEPELERRFRARALGAGFAAGAAAAAGLVVLAFDAHHLFERLVDGRALPTLLISISAGVATLTLVWIKRYEPARYTAGIAVGSIIFGWALAQAPAFLTRLTIEQAAAPRDTLVAVSVAVIAGGIVLFPSLALLFRLVLAGELDESPEATPRSRRRRSAGRTGWRILLMPSAARLAAAFLVGGIGFTTVANSGWSHAVGVVLLFGFAIFGFRSVLPPDSFEAG
jgi:cytochrome d ubiquinol oxidase subunit II